MSLAPLELRTTTFDWSRTYIVGVVNVTPDSFSDGGQFADVESAVRQAHALIEAGADVVDIGGESTRPIGATRVAAADEIERVVPVIRALADAPVAISVDTTKAAVARAALDAGAEIVNDISGGAFDPEIIPVAAAAGAVFVCGHVRGTSLAEVHSAEADPPGFDDVASELASVLAGLPSSMRRRTIVDPGLGFGKATAQNLELSRRAGELGTGLGCPVMVGPSRKRFLGDITGAAANDRDPATVGACLAAVAAGAQLVRIHNVKLLAPALMVYEAIRGR